MKYCNRVVHKILFFGILTCIILFILYQKNNYSQINIELCVADYLIISMNPKIIGLMVGTMSLLIVFNDVNDININALIRYGSREKYCCKRVSRIIKKTTFIVTIFELFILFAGFFTCKDVINWNEYTSYYYHLTWHIVNVNLFEVCIMFTLSGFIGILSINLLFSAFRWIFDTALPGFIICSCFIVLDSIGITIIFNRLNFTECWFDFKYPIAIYIVPVVVLFIIFAINFVGCKIKEFSHENGQHI